MEDERGRVLDVVEGDLHVVAQPVLRRPARPHRARVEGVAEADREAGRRCTGAGVQAQPELLLRGQVPVHRIRALGHRLGGSVDRDRHDHDGEAAEERERRVGGEPVRDDVAQAGAADQPGDHDHREREQDRLVDRQQQHPPCERQLHLEDRLPPRCAECQRGLYGVRRHLADSERGDPDRRRDRVDHRRHDRRSRADREEDHNREQVGECRDDLHRVEERRDRAPEAVGAAGDHAERHADEQREPDGGDRERERLDALLPEAHQRERPEREQDPGRRAPAAEAEHEQGREQRRPRPGELLEERRQPGDEVVEEVREAVENREHEARVRDVAVVAQPDLEAVEVAPERVPDERARPVRDVRRLPAEESDQHREGDGDDDPEASPPPGAAVRRGGCRSDDLGGAQLSALAGDGVEDGDAVDDADDLPLLDGAHRLFRRFLLVLLLRKDGSQRDGERDRHEESPRACHRSFFLLSFSSLAIGVFSKLEPLLSELRGAYGPQFAASLEKLIDETPEGRQRVALARERMKGIRAKLATKQTMAAGRS